jgi:hypothetical protein
MKINIKNLFRKSLIAFSVVFIMIQFIKPEKNESGVSNQDISSKYPVPASIKEILTVSCYDCHSNKTIYPWYANIQPVAWWLADHIDEGKDELNFNEFAQYRIFRQYKKLEEITEMIEEDEMPLSSYTFIHKNAVLNDEQKTELINWAKGLGELIKANYPTDSLQRPKKR